MVAGVGFTKEVRLKDRSGNIPYATCTCKMKEN